MFRVGVSFKLVLLIYGEKTLQAYCIFYLMVYIR